jgi:alpha/beta superfamily hydrolase
MPEMEDVWFESSGYKLRGGLFVPEVASKGRIPCLIYCCGFPGSDKTNSKIAQALSEGGYVALWFDYRGVRESEGELDFVSQVDDLRAAIDYLETRNEVDDKIAVIGHCFGGRVAICEAADDQRVRAVAVWDTVGDMREQVETLGFRIIWWLYCSLWPRNVQGKRGMNEKVKEAALKLNPIEHIGRISPRPILIIHREKDMFAPVDYAYELERNAGQTKDLIIAKGRMHMDSDSFFSSKDRDDGAIRLTLDWLDRKVKLEMK